MLRKKYKAIRKEYVLSNPHAPQTIETNLITAIGPTAAGRIWAGFRPKEYEAGPDLEFYEDSPINWAFPKVIGQDLRFFIPKEKSAWIKGNFNVWEPDPASSTSVELDQLSGMLIPGIAFDHFGYRLGWGLGFYDRVLEAFEGSKIGVAYSPQLSDHEMPSEDHDVPVDVLVTDTGIFELVEERNGK